MCQMQIMIHATVQNTRIHNGAEYSDLNNDVLSLGEFLTSEIHEKDVIKKIFESCH